MVDGHFTHHGQVGFSYILAYYIPITYILSTVLSFAKEPLGRYFMTYVKANQRMKVVENYI